MSPADFNALCEGYENKKHAEHELMRQQTFVLVSPYMDKGSGYERFKARWRFAWENVSVPELQPLTEADIEAIKERHSKFIKR